MSPKSLFMSGKGRRTIGKPGRFDPTEPLHMTTRHAARNGRPSGTSPTDESFDDNDSRRGSLDDLDPTAASQSLGSQYSAKERRVSGTSANSASDINASVESSPLFPELDRGLPQTVSPAFRSPSPSRKRKRSTSSPIFIPKEDENVISPPLNDSTYKDPRDVVEVIAPDDLSDRESDGTSDSDDEQYAGGYLIATQSTDITPEATPAGSEPVSPVSDESNDGVIFPSKPSEIVIMTEASQQPEDQDDIEDADELAEADEVEDGDDMDDDGDMDDQGRVDADGKPRRRLAGRRRADHPDPIIEATLRRQLQLKSAYRVIARALKPVLAEIVLKTTEDLEANPILHEQSVEYHGTDDYPGIQKLLDDALAKRRAQLDAQLKWNKAQLRRTLDGESRVRKSTCKAKLDDMRELQIDRLHHEVLTVTRQAQLEGDNNGYQTEDEDNDIILVPKRTGYRFIRSNALESKYHSRSRLALESERALEDLRIRFDMQQMIRDTPQDELADEETSNRNDFTVMDNRPREAALVRRECIGNMNILADAATEIERVSNIPIIPNEAAVGLQLLGDLATRPSVRASVLAPPPPTPPTQAARARAQPFGTPVLNQMPPPTPLRHQPPTLRPPISFQRRPYDQPPRTTAFPEPFNLPPPPPLTARPEHIPGATRRIAESPRRISESSRRIPESTRRIPESTRRLPESTRQFSESPRHPSESTRREPQLMLSSQLNLNRGDTLPPLSLRPPTSAPPSRHESLSSAPLKQADLLDHSLVQQRPQSSQHAAHKNRESEESAWQRFNPRLTIDRSPRAPLSVKRSVHEFSRAGPLSIERVEPVESQMSLPDKESSAQHQGNLSRGEVDLQQRREYNKDQTTPQYKLHDRLQTGPSSKQGTADLQRAMEHSPPATPADLAHEVSTRKARSRASSIISQSTNAEASPDDVSLGESGQRGHKPRGSKAHSFKTSKAERNGLTRKAFKTQKDASRRDKTNGPTVHRFRLNAVDTTRATTPAAPSWLAIPVSHAFYPIDYYTQYPYSMPGHTLPPLPPNYPVSYTPEYSQNYQHRNSFSIPGPQNMPWPPQPQSPLFAIPQGAQQSPSGQGGPPDQWPTQGPYSGPPGGPQTPQPPSSSGSFNQRFAPPIAPAAPSNLDPRLVQAGPNNHPPAFAQQQRQQDANPRRRTQSDAQGHRFQHWNPRRT